MYKMSIFDFLLIAGNKKQMLHHENNGYLNLLFLGIVLALFLLGISLIAFFELLRVMGIYVKGNKPSALEICGYISVVAHNCGEEIVTVANNAGAGGGTIVMGRGTASNSIIQLLGLGDTQKDVVFIIVESDVEKAVRSAIMEAVSDRKGHFGFMVSCKLNGFIKAGDLDKNFEEEKGAEKMADGYEMINVIVNKGYAEDAMAAARKAGAGGGTGEAEA